MENSRERLILQKLNYQQQLQELESSTEYDATKGTNVCDRQNAIEVWKSLQEYCNDQLQKAMDILKENEAPLKHISVTTLANTNITLARRVPPVTNNRPVLVPYSDTESSDEDVEVEPDQHCQEKKQHDGQIVVPKISNSKLQRVYDKKTSCFYCSKLCSNLPEHLRLVHKEEKEVVQFLLLKKNSKERRLAILALRNKGNYVHNKNVLGAGTGSILTRKRPFRDVDGDNFLPCEFCLGFYNKSHLSRHTSNCSLNFCKTEINSTRRNTVRRSTALLKAPKSLSSNLKVVLSSMKVNDEESLVVRNDKLIRKLGEMLCEINKNNLEHKKNEISQRMRELARLLLILQKENSDITSLSKALRPVNFQTIIRATRNLCMLNYSEGKPKRTLALQIGSSIQKCVQILKSEGIMENNEEKRKLAADFVSLYDIHWSSSVAQRAIELIGKAKYNTSITPLAEGIEKMNVYSKEQDVVDNRLCSHEATKEDYVELCNLTLGHLDIDTEEASTSKEHSIFDSLNSYLRSTEPKSSKCHNNLHAKRESTAKRNDTGEETATSKSTALTCKKQRESWNSVENEAVSAYFSKHIQLETVPNKAECDKCLKEHNCLSSRSWVVIKSKVKNIITTNKKRKIML